MLAAGTVVHGQTTTKTWVVPSGTGNANGNGDWSVGTNWDAGTAPNATTDIAAFNGAPGTATRTISVDGAFTIGGLTVNSNTTPGTTLQNGSTAARLLTFDAGETGGTEVTVTVGGTGAGNFQILANAAFNDSVTAIVNQTSATSAAGSLNWTGAITDSPGGFTKQGPGVLTFGTNAKLYRGPTVFDTNSGRTRISVAGSPTATSGVTVRSGAQIELITGTAAAPGVYTWGSGSLNLNGTGLGAGSHPGNFPGAIRPSTNVVAEITNPVVLQSDTLIHVQGAASGQTTLSGGVSGVGGLTFTAPGSNQDIGKLHLSGPGTFTGATVVNAGTLRLNAATGAALGGTSSISVATNEFNARGILQLEKNDQINNAAPLTLNNATFNTLGNSEGSTDPAGKGVAGVGALTMPASSILDLGSGASLIAFANSSGSAWTGELSVYNYSGNPDVGGGTDRLFFGSDAAGLTAAQLGQIRFFSDAGTTPVGASNYILSTGEVIPVVNGVPEPAGLALLGLGAAGLLGRRRQR